MRLENQVCSLDLAEELFHLKVEQTSLFYWVKKDFSYNVNVLSLNEFSERFQAEFNGFKFSAFTVAELGEILPNKYYTEIDERGGWIGRMKNNSDRAFDSYWDESISKNEVDARAKLLIHLHKKGFMV